jgi:hypothetical protein
MSDLITMPRAVAEKTLEALEHSVKLRDSDYDAMDALRGWLAAPTEKAEAEVERLRALFPELLEALKLAQRIIGHPDDAHSKLITAAIVKAEGQR